MKVTILGSCTVVDLEKNLDAFFDNERLIDNRNGSRMEMDSLPLFNIAFNNKDLELGQKIINGLNFNWSDSGNSLWICGCWGHNEIHLRFTSTALRTLLLACNYTPNLKSDVCIKEALEQHISYKEENENYVWFLHDSLESDQFSFYPHWHGEDFLGFAKHNRLILNTHIDTLITLLMFRHYGELCDSQHMLVDKALKTLGEFINETNRITGFLSKVDRIFRGLLSRLSGRKALLARVASALIERIYYQRVRYHFKKKHHALIFDDGYIERDLRLSGQSIEYHIVNIWDISRLLLWLNIEQKGTNQLTSSLTSIAKRGLKYCLKSRSYTNFIQRKSSGTGVANEILESIVILFCLGESEDWMRELYMQYRQYAPASSAILGIDLSLCIPTEKSINIPDVDFITLRNGKTFIANYSKETKSIAIHHNNEVIIKSQCIVVV
ncbi:hypothetical protein [Thalassotalea marina]|uniref:Uncharacterized protein n=1 Tax=Thalassotalea marina TaxID=1673741 RepID=A0A919BD67_9GAMM|nr:hypothetical protein [Thalassotalea marina]GHF80982.1 hypothetical protein GCM10017161_05380 [Thalassotalea marina]